MCLCMISLHVSGTELPKMQRNKGNFVRISGKQIPSTSN
ncbi:hypothetical protein WPG_2796 [Winogradskyella sp. PG-2]|nr:hypothetical protein WPG_2796 [Winogradskyella sp. PG-2]